MYTVLAIGAISIVLLYLSQFVLRFLRNLNDARRSGFTYWVLPMDQHFLPWVVSSVPLRPWLKKNMPAWIWDRISMTIYGFEFSEKDRMLGQRSSPPAIKDDTYVMVTAGSYEVNTRDPEIAYEILRRPKDFMQMEIVSMFAAKFGHNVLTSNGEKWSRQRRVVASAINERISKTVFEESAIQAQGLVDEVVGTESTAQSSLIFDAMKKITINVLSGAGMGARVQWKEDLEAKPRPGYQMTYIEACQVVINGMCGPIILPKWFLDNYPSFLPGHKYFNDMGCAIVEFPQHTKHLLDVEEERIKTSGESRNNIMSQLLQAAKQSDANGKETAGLSESEMIGNLFVFTAAGFDTTANTLSYAIMLVSRYPQWQQFLFEEIDEIVPKDAGEALDYASIFPKATRVLAFMMEVLRFFPPLVHITKGAQLPQTITTSKGTYHFPGKSIIYINAVGLHMSPDVFRNTNLAPGEIASDTDETAFRPTRWLNPKGSAQALFQPPKGVFVPWSAGPRVCPGQKMSQIEFVSIFITILRHHRIEAVPLLDQASGKTESLEQMNTRLEKLMSDSSPIMTLQMNGVYDIAADSDKGVPIKLTRRN